MDDNSQPKFVLAMHGMEFYVQAALTKLLREADDWEFETLRAHLSSADLTSVFLAKAVASTSKDLARGLDEKEGRQRTADALAALGASGARELANHLQHKDDDTRAIIVAALGSMGEFAAPYVTAVSALLRDSDWRVRKAAAETLGSSGDAGLAHVAAIAALLKHRNQSVRWAAVEVLTRMGKPGAGAVVPLLTDWDWKVRIAAVDALGSMGRLGAPHAQAVAQQLKDFSQEGSDFVCASAMDALECMGTAGGEAAAELLQDSDFRVCKNAADVLGRMGEIGATHASDVANLLKHYNPITRGAATHALSRMGKAGAAAVAVLLEESGKESDWKVRKNAVEALGCMAVPGCAHVAKVTGLLHDANEFVRASAMKTLRLMGKDGASATAGVLSDADWRVRMVAARTLGGMGAAGAEHAKDVGALLMDPDALVRLAAMEALGGMGNAGANAAVALLEDSDWRVRKAGADALNFLGDLAAEANAVRVDADA